MCYLSGSGIIKETIDINKTEDIRTRKPKKRNVWDLY